MASRPAAEAAHEDEEEEEFEELPAGGYHMEGEEHHEEEEEEDAEEEEEAEAGEIVEAPAQEEEQAEAQPAAEEAAEAAIKADEQERPAAPHEVEPEQQLPETSTTAPAATASATANAASSPPGGEMDLKQLEAQATKVAKDMQHAALEMSNKLSESFKSALGGLGTSEPPTLSKLAGGLASWWSSLDPPAAPKRNEMAEAVQASSKATSELQVLFGLLPEENLVESFKCKLLQTYGCNHNAFTPAIQMAFQGTMYITDKHTCFCVEERNRKMPFKILHTEIAKAERHRPQRKGDLSDVLRLELQPGTSGDASQQSLAFKDFDSGSALDSALALVEHLMDG